MIIHGDCLSKLHEMADNSIDSIVTDPPYGLKFMGKKWDYEVPSPDVWRECLRVLKPGGHALIACGTRTQHRMAVNIEDAGFEIRDVITWLYGSGFPKSLNIGKQGGPEGWGTALKPACEFWTLARKPLGESTVAKNVQRWGTGGINVDGCRIETTELCGKIYNNKNTGWKCSSSPSVQFGNSQGRFPANLILDEEAALQLDLQSGTSGGDKRTVKKHIGLAGNGNTMGVMNPAENGSPCYQDSGGASRFFYTAKASKSERNAGCEGMPIVEISGQPSFLDAGGVSKSSGKPNKPICNQNHHPTVKPIKLMAYLCRLITPLGGVVLDPFMGSGSTGVAAKAEGFEFIGIEREAEYVEIARKRIA